ncbi:MAG: response regulator, partial [Rhodocyclaceae bacterium]|nr:response regulator [Rhodocyclaceae bacterium]
SRVGETIVKAIQQGLEIAPALCCIVGADDNCLYVHSWQSLDMQPEMSVFNLDEPAAGGGESELSLVSCLKDLGLWRSDTGSNAAAFDAIVRRDGLLVLPFAAQGATYGHLVFGAEISGARDIDHDLAQYIEFTAGCAQALARWRDEKQHRIRYESLVDDLSASVSSQEATDWRDLTHIALQAIQNTLSKGMAHAEWLRARVQDGQARRAGDALLQHNQEAAAIVRDLGMLLRPEPPRKEPSLANYAIHRAVLTAQERLQGQGIALTERYEEGLPRIAVDRRQMEQVLVSILNNAEDALASRGGRIEIATAAAPDRKGVIVSIADNGPGIQGESMELAFEPFFTTRGDRGRLGLGLTVCRTIMENHGGSIALRRAREGGTVVELTFPSASGVSSDRMVVDLDAVRNSFEQNAGTVLLIGGQAPLRQMLLDRGFVVESSPAGPEAIEALLRRPVDITIVDLPDLNPEHASFVSQVRYHRPSVPVIVMTAAGQSEGASELLRRGVRACLTKPVDGNVLLAEIEGLNITGRA